MDNENMWDKLLKIKTTGRDDSNSDQYRYPYEPTPYSVLERLANSGFICKRDVVIDYGCGKGRVDFFLSYQTKSPPFFISLHQEIPWQQGLHAPPSADSAPGCSPISFLRSQEYYVTKC